LTRPRRLATPGPDGWLPCPAAGDALERLRPWGRPVPVMRTSRVVGFTVTQ